MGVAQTTEVCSACCANDQNGQTEIRTINEESAEIIPETHKKKTAWNSFKALDDI